MASLTEATSYATRVVGRDGKCHQEFGAVLRPTTHVLLRAEAPYLLYSAPGAILWDAMQRNAMFSLRQNFTFPILDLMLSTTDVYPPE